MVSRLRLPAFHDIARLIGRDVDETEANLYRHVTNPFGAFFNYRRAHNLSRYAYGHVLPLRFILDGCGRERTQQGKTSNAEVLRLLWERSAGRRLKTYELAPKFLAIRRDMNIRVAPPFYFVEGDRAYVFWLQPRKGYALKVGELGLLASMVKLTFLRDDFRDVGFELLDLSAPSPGKPRDPKLYHLESFNILSEAEIRQKLQFFAIAYDRLVARGIERSERTPKRPSAKGSDLFSDTHE